MLGKVREIPLLHDLSDEQIELITSLFENFTSPPQQTIIRQDEPANYLYILTNGIVALHYKPYDGARIILTRLHAGDAFGWSSVIGGSVYTSDICSETDIEAVRIRGSALRKLCREHPEIGRIFLDRLAESVSGRWQNSRQQVQTILNRNIKHRKAK